MANQPPHRNQVLVELSNGECRLEEVVEVRPLSLVFAYRGPGHMLTVGQELTQIRVFSEGTSVLTCAARVARCEALAGGASIRVSLDLLVSAQSNGEEERQASAVAQMVTDLVQARSRAGVTIDGVALPQQALIIGVYGEPKGLMLELQGPAKPWRPFAACELTCELYGRRVVLLCKLRSQSSGRRGITELYVDWPTAVKTTRRRAMQRVKSSQAPLRVQARLPFAANQRQFHVADLSSGGFAFEANVDDCLTVGMVLPTLDISLPQGRVRARGEVRNVRAHGGKLSVGVVLHDMSPASERVLHEYVDAQTSPNMRAARLNDLPQLWSLYKECGFLDAGAQARQLRQMETVRTALLTRGQQILVQLVLNAGEEILGTAELVRVGERTWRLQQVAIRPGSNTQPGALMGPLLQAALRRDDCGYIQVLRHVPGMPENLPAMASPAHVSLRHWAWVTGAPGPLDNDLSDETHEAGSDDRDWVAQKLQRQFTALELMALDLNGRTLQLAGVARLYRAAGLNCQRQVRLATSISDTLGFSLLDIGLPGPQGDGTTLTRLFAVGQLAHSRKAALMTLIRDADAVLRPLGQVPGFLLKSEDAELLRGGTFEHRGTYVEMTVERSQFVELPRLIAALQP